MNIIEITLLIVNIMTSPFQLLNYFVGRKSRYKTTKNKIVPKSYCTERVRAPLGDYIFNRSQYALLKRLKDHIDINYILHTLQSYVLPIRNTRNIAH